MYFNEKIFNDITNELVRQLNKMNKTSLSIQDIKSKNLVFSLYSKKDVKQVIKSVVNQVNLQRFDMSQLREFIRTGKKDYLKRKVSLVGEITNIFTKIAEDVLLFIITLFIVLRIKFRNIIKADYLYPSDPNRFPYMVYDEESCLHNDDACYGISSNDTHGKFNVFESQHYTSENETTKIHDINMILGKTNTNIFLNSKDKDYEEIKDKYMNEKYPTSVTDGVTKMSSLSKRFIDSVRNKTRDDLGVFDLVNYILHYNDYNIQGFVASLDKVFKSSYDFLDFGMVLILFYTFFKTFSKVTKTVIKTSIKTFKSFSYLKNFSKDFKQSNKKPNKSNSVILDVLSKSLFALFIPFVTLFICISIVIYPMMLVNSIFANKNFLELTNSYFTKFLCFMGMMYPVMTLLSFFVKKANKSSSKKGGGGGGGKNTNNSDKLQRLSNKKKKVSAKKQELEKKKQRQKEKLKSFKKGSKKRKKMKEKIRRSRKKIKNKNKKIKKINKNTKKRKSGKKKGKGRKKKGNGRKKKKKRSGFQSREGFNDKFCSPNPFAGINFVGKMFMFFTTLLTIFIMIPASLPIYSTTLTAFNLAYKLTFGEQTPNFEDMSKSINRKRTSIIISFVVLIILDKVISVFSNDSYKKNITTSNIITNIVGYGAIIAMMMFKLNSIRSSLNKNINGEDINSNISNDKLVNQ